MWTENVYRKVTDKADRKAAMDLFNNCVAEGEVLFKPFVSEREFESFFLSREDQVQTVSLIDEERCCFASGCLNAQKTKGYITFVAVRPDRRRQGIGRSILSALERELAELAGEKVDCEATFFNPMNFTWIIPGTDHEHPNAPGVDVAGNGYLFLKNCGYRDYAYQNSYYLDMDKYQLTEDVQRKQKSLLEKGIEICLYDPAKHSGIEEMLRNLNSELWYKEIMENIRREDGGDPLLIVAKDGRAMGFTGPLRIQENGRGYLAGVGVHSDCRGAGAGTVLFGQLCAHLRDMGAEYMTLFTGETNPARNIYEAQGFKIVRTWADMRKQVKK